MATQTQRKESAALPVSPPAAVPAIIPVAPSPVSLGTLQAATPGALVTGAAELAGELANIIQRQNLAVGLQGRQYVKCEGWTTLGVMLGCVAREVTTTEQDGIYTATVEMIRMADGACISRASAECGAPDEKDRYGNPLWSSRPRYARRSMAQTRATAKACRLAFSWIMALAGYQPTPAEEMGTEMEPEPTQPAPPARISASQHKLLEAQIRDYGLDRQGLGRSPPARPHPGSVRAPVAQARCLGGRGVRQGRSRGPRASRANTGRLPLLNHPARPGDRSRPSGE